MCPFVSQFIYIEVDFIHQNLTIGKPTKDKTKLKNIFKQPKMIQDLRSKEMRSKTQPTQLLL